MKEDTARCLDSLYRDSAGSTLRVSVIVVDNASRDDIEGYLKLNFPQVRCIVLSENVGFGRGQNAAMKAVDAKYY
ncbi:MAG: glycosyltransferase, partial [Patescibacteria group bacterium]